MKRNFLKARARVFSPDREKEANILFDAYLAPCWVHRAAAMRWLEAKGCPVPPLWEQAKHPEEPPMVVSKKKQGKRGRRPGYDWEEAQLYAEKLFNLNGDYEVQMNAKEGWRSQADLERLVGDHIEKLDKKRPVDSTIRNHIVPIIEAYRNKQGADN